jgi:DinB superfamily
MVNRRKTAFTMTLLLTCSSMAMSQSSKPAEPYSARQALDDRITVVERQVVSGADAMPEDKYGFAPTNGEFAGVRTFAEQVKHAAAANWQLGSKVLGEEPPAGTKNETAPESVKTKAEIMAYLRGSFACLHRATATVNEKNLAEPIKGLSGTWQRMRLGLLIDAIAHSSDHYGQMVEYLRMNGIVPPESR